MIKIVTDTTAGLPPEVTEKEGVAVLPQIIIFGDEAFRDDTELDTETFLSKLRSSEKLPTTSAPPPELYHPILDELTAEQWTVLCLHPSSELSRTVQSAHVASQDYPDADIRVIDTRSIAAPLGMMVLKAAKWAGLIGIQNAAVLRRDQKDKLHIKELKDWGGGKGAVFGGALGAVVGVLAGPGALAVGAAGALIGGLAAKLRDSGFSDARLKAVGDSLKPGTSAIVAVIEHKRVAQLQKEMEEAEAPNLHDHVKLYQDGEPAVIHDIGLLDLWPLETGGELDLRIGRRFNGLIDDVRVYDRALSIEEIQALFNVKSKSK